MEVPVMVWTSEPQTPQASILMSISRSSNFFGLIYDIDSCQLAPRQEHVVDTNLVFLELAPILFGVDHEPLESIWIAHLAWLISKVVRKRMAIRSDLRAE